MLQTIAARKSFKIIKVVTASVANKVFEFVRLAHWDRQNVARSASPLTRRYKA